MGKTTHGKRHTRIYKTWTDMKSRCLNPNRPKYKRYGGRGITICEEWLNSFEAFYDWAMANGYREDLTIDRIDNDGNYEPSNCRWITLAEQAANKSTNHFITHEGMTFTIAEWARRINVRREVLKDRICRYGWSPERALTTPVRSHKTYDKRSN